TEWSALQTRFYALLTFGSSFDATASLVLLRVALFAASFLRFDLDVFNIAVADAALCELIVRPIGDPFLVETEPAVYMKDVSLDVLFERANFHHRRCSYGCGPQGGMTGGTGPEGKPSSDVRS